MTNEEAIKKIRSNINLVALICEYVPLYPSLNCDINLHGCCPFCKDTERNLSVSNKKQIFYCFSCREGGDSVSFISSIKKITPKKAIDYLLKKVDDENKEEEEEEVND